MIIPTMDEILNFFPGNRAVYDRLKSSLNSKSAVAFVGAGASFPLYPLWPQLIETFAKEPIRLGLAAEEDKAYWIRKASTKPLQVAALIRQKLGDSNYFSLLFDTFKSRTTNDNLAYTSTHAALAKMNFKAYITTNYDAGILEAQHHSHPNALSTGFTIWNQSFQMNRWASGDAFRDCTIAPILFAHGHFNDPPNIVLDHGSYRLAYHNTPYRRFFENIWIQECLVFIGFSFNDVVLTQIADEILGQTIRQGGGPPRHIAVLGWPEEDRSTMECRREYLDSFNAELILYPIRRSADGSLDHSAINVMLDSLRYTDINLVSQVVPARETNNVNESIPTWFVHETTEDELFVGRELLSARMDAWAIDEGVRIVAISAIGGQGKTAFITRWMKSGNYTEARRSEGCFFWSFYRDREVASFFQTLIDFGATQLEFTVTRRSLSEQCLELLLARRLIVVLDGLEVVQETPGTIAYGKVLDYSLADFLHRHCNSTSDSLVLLTSRFPFPDLTPYLGGALRTLSLSELSGAEGANLLKLLGIGGTDADREVISKRLSGHPLALRLFARSMPRELQGDPTRLWERIFTPSSLTTDDTLASKMGRLLSFYEAHLPNAHRRALGLIALFRTSVSERTLSLLWRKLPRDNEDNNSLNSALEALRRDHLLNIDSASDGAQAYSCHPILRDHFRASLLEKKTLTQDVVDLLAGRPDSSIQITIGGAQSVGTAIELLLAANEFYHADDLYASRFKNGRLFNELMNPLLGLTIASEFVRDADRQMALRKRINILRLSFYFNEVGLFSDLVGEPTTSLKHYKEAEVLDRRRPIIGAKALCITLQNVASVEMQLGLLSKSSNRFSELLKIIKNKDEELKRDALAYSAYIASLRGNVRDAERRFSKAHELDKSMGNDELHADFRVYQAEHLLRIGKIKEAYELMTRNLKECRENGFIETEVQCIWALGWIAIHKHQPGPAQEYLNEAKNRFNAGHMIYPLIRALITEVELQTRLKNWDVALGICERAIHLAAPRNYRLVHADALNLRASIWLQQDRPAPERTRDDAEAALQIAEVCGYAWAQRDAHNLLARAFQHMGQHDDSQKHQRDADHWKSRLTPPA